MDVTQTPLDSNPFKAFFHLDSGTTYLDNPGMLAQAVHTSLTKNIRSPGGM